MKKRFFRFGVCLMILAMLFTNLFLARAEGETEEPEYYTDPNQVAAIIRDAMEARQEQFTVGIIVEGQLPEGEEEQKAWLGGIALDDLLERAFAETENATEGDSLRFAEDGIVISGDFSSSGNQLRLKITYTPNYFTNAEQEAQLSQAVDALMAEFAFTAQTTEKEKVDAIYGWICNNVEYDYEHNDKYLLKFTDYGALIDRKAVCEGYATLFYRLAKQAGLDVRVVTGESFGQGHSWNIVRLDGAYYYLDSTWDASRRSDRYQYYLKGTSDFNNHRLDDQFLTEEFRARYPISSLNYENHLHQFDNDCDDRCNTCNFTRAIVHQYDHACDTECNTCSATRTISHNFGSYVYNNDATTLKDGTKTRICAVCKKAETIVAEGTKLPNPFTDLKKDAYYTEAVLWAVEKEITTGMTATTFGPAETCTRAQIVTFLWRAAGKPTPKTVNNPFKDVKESDYFYNAVLWAVENNITQGTGKGYFSPKNPCTRDQVVTFLWRAMGKPSSKTANSFSDVKAGSFYYDAVLWAVENGVTNGTGVGRFSPKDSCIRGQIVTFLYRVYK